MKTLLVLALSLSLLCVTTGCQKTATPAERAKSSTTAQPKNNPAVSEQSSESTNESQTADADQPDDPGMTTAHDKTVKQETPSGDESSRAAPNEGDAEPPQ
jgi:hypothetical protein